ncbi:MAG: ribosome-associated translation inhibitor RaiA [Candidatus Gastranaerophilales bacterium]|nr:ribosome-associated translation inhibitor RaiA [Candidatus Gastranaerophilales bacterium]
MQIIVNGRNIEITPAIKAYVKEKMGKVVEHYDQLIDLEVILTVIKNPSVPDSHIAEAKSNLAGARIHIEEKGESMYASIDLLADKLNRQVQKHKDKSIKGKFKAESIRTTAVPMPEGEEPEAETVEE